MSSWPRRFFANHDSKVRCRHDSFYVDSGGDWGLRDVSDTAKAATWKKRKTRTKQDAKKKERRKEEEKVKDKGAKEEKHGERSPSGRRPSRDHQMLKGESIKPHRGTASGEAGPIGPLSRDHQMLKGKSIKPHRGTGSGEAGPIGPLSRDHQMLKGESIKPHRGRRAQSGVFPETTRC